MAIHGYVSTALCACTDVGALNACGIHSAADLDNGVMVKITKMAQNEKKEAQGYQYEVTPASENDEDVYLVATPEVGSDLMMQAMSDPRYFYNAAGRPMSIKKLVPTVDIVEFTKEAFSTAALPDGTSNGYAKIGEGGKLVPAASAPASGAYYTFVAKETMAIGAEAVPTVLMRYQVKKA